MDTENSNICSSMDDRFRDNGTTTVFARFMRRSIYRLSSVGDRRVNDYLLPPPSHPPPGLCTCKFIFTCKFVWSDTYGHGR